MQREHKTQTIVDSDRIKITYCILCSAEGDDLNKPCPGKFNPEKLGDTRNKG